MAECVKSAGDGHFCGQCQHEIRVQHGIFADCRIGKHREFTTGGSFGDHQRIGHFAAGAGGGRNCDHTVAWCDRLGWIGVFNDGSAVDTHDVDASGNIHGTATADGDDAVSLVCFECFDAGFHGFAKRVGLDLVEYRHIDTGLFKLGTCGNDQWHASDEGIRDHQRTRVARGLHDIDQSLP